jgi:diguanylate cyclase (GGDEF)-like protein
VSPFDTLRVRRAVFLSAGGLAVFLSYVAVMSGAAPDADVGPVSVASVLFPGLVTGFVMVAYVAWETRNVRLASHRAEELNTQLVRKEIELGRISTLDELTRLYTRREFDNSLRLEFERRRRYGRDLSLLLLDVDHVGDVSDGRMNKTYLLSEVAAIFRLILRANDIGCRYSTDRLGLLLPETDDIRAQLVADKIRDAVAKHEFLGTLADGGVRLTVSAGIAVATDDFQTAEEFVGAAESALGESIAAGYNQVRLYCAPETPDDDEAGPYSLAS